MNFRVGQKVVCVDAGNTHRRGIQELAEGAIYTVAWFGVDKDGDTSVRLAEVRRRHGSIDDAVKWAPYDCPFLASRFRPAADTTKQVESLKELVRPIMEGKEVEIVK